MCIQSWLPLKSRGLTQRVFGKKIPKDFLRDFKHFGVWPSVFSGKKTENSILIRFWKFVKSGVWPSVFSGKKFRMSVFFSWKHAGSNPRNQKNKNLLSTSSWFLRGIFFLRTRWVKPRNSGFFFPDLPIGVKGFWDHVGIDVRSRFGLLLIGLFTSYLCDEAKSNPENQVTPTKLDML